MVKRILDKDVSSGSSPLGIISCFYSVCKAKQSKAKQSKASYRSWPSLDRIKGDWLERLKAVNLKFTK